MDLEQSIDIARPQGLRIWTLAMLMEPTAEGGTAFTMHFRAEPRGLWRVMEPMMRAQMGKELGRTQLRIKEMVESS